MKNLVEFALEDGSTILVEVEEPENEAIEPIALKPGQIATHAKKTFEEAIDKIQPMASKIVSKLRSLPEPADELEVKFGFKLSGQVGAVLTSIGGEATYEITLKWSNKG